MDPVAEVDRLRAENQIQAAVIEDLGALADQLADVLRAWVYGIGHESASVTALEKWEALRGP